MSGAFMVWGWYLPHEVELTRFLKPEELAQMQEWLADGQNGTSGGYAFTEQSGLPARTVFNFADHNTAFYFKFRWA